MPERIHFFNTDLNISNRGEVLESIKEGDSLRIATVNPEFMLEAQKNDNFRRILGEMTHCIIDGSGLYGMVKFARRRIKMQTEPQLYHGADLVEDLFAAYQDGSKKFFFLGNAEGVAQTACKAIRNRFPRIQIVGATDGGMIDINNPVNPALLTEIEALGTDILFVGFGAPKQETWINVAKDSKIQVMIGVGGTLNFYTNKSRAPKWMQVIHMEWLFRSLTEKGHFKRAFRGVFVFPIKSLFSFFGK